MINNAPLTILLADDDADDRLLVREAFEENHLLNPLHTVEDGEELMDYLYGRGKFAGIAARPNLILLDLNMPVKNGLECLELLRAEQKFDSISIIIYSTSRSVKDIDEAYQPANG